MAAVHEGDEAVSPVIGVLIMVAITVVVAATVYLFAYGLAEPPKGTPVVSFNADDKNGILTLISLHPPGDSFWADFSVASGAAGDLGIDSAPIGPDALAPDVYVPMGGAFGGPADSRIMNGASINFCAEPGPATNVLISIRHEETRRLVYSHTFLTLPAC